MKYSIITKKHIFMLFENLKNQNSRPNMVSPKKPPQLCLTKLQQF